MGVKFELFLAHDLVQLLPPGQLVQVAGLASEFVVEVFDAVAADHALDQVGVGVQGGAFEELLEGDFVVDLLFERSFVKTGESLDHVVELFFGAAFLLDFGDVVRVYTDKDNVGNAFVVLRGCGCGNSSWYYASAK